MDKIKVPMEQLMSSNSKESEISSSQASDIPTIAIIHASVGSGHKAAAQAIAQAVDR